MKRWVSIAMLAAATLLSAGVAVPARADSIVMFSSPSHGIGCVLYNGVLR
jgi:hypothetical protein